MIQSFLSHNREKKIHSEREFVHQHFEEGPLRNHAAHESILPFMMAAWREAASLSTTVSPPGALVGSVEHTGEQVPGG